MNDKRIITELPQADVFRLPCVDGCFAKEDKEDEKFSTPDCNKVFACKNGENVCIAYENPKRIWSKGPCYLASNKPMAKEEKAKMKRKFGLKRRNR